LKVGHILDDGPDSCPLQRRRALHRAIPEPWLRSADVNVRLSNELLDELPVRLRVEHDGDPALDADRRYEEALASRGDQPMASLRAS